MKSLKQYLNESKSRYLEVSSNNKDIVLRVEHVTFAKKPSVKFSIITNDQVYGEDIIYEFIDEQQINKAIQQLKSLPNLNPIRPGIKLDGIKFKKVTSKQFQDWLDQLLAIKDITYERWWVIMRNRGIDTYKGKDLLGLEK